MPGLDPGPHQPLRRAGTGWKPSGLGAERAGKAGVGVDVGDQPGLGGVGEVAVGQQHHRRHVVHGDAHGLDAPSKQSAGVAAARTTIGASPLRP